MGGVFPGRTGWGWAAACVLAFAGVARAAPAGPLSETLTGTAKTDYEAGKLLFGDGDYAGAEIKFHAAYDLSHDARLLWNVAACDKNLRHYALAARLVHEYLDAAGPLLTDQDREGAKQLLDALQAFIVKLTVVVNEPGAEIDVDDARVGTSPLEKPIILDLGQRKVVAKKPGFKEATRSITLGAKPEERIDLVLAPDLHQGAIVVTTMPGARVLIDGSVVGAGGYRGKLKSGGHTLRVEAAGMQPLQQEVVVEDDQTRTIDAPLVPLPAGAVAAGPVWRGFTGMVQFNFSYGAGSRYQAPSIDPSTSVVVDGPYAAAIGLRLGYTFGWYGVEGVADFQSGFYQQTVFPSAASVPGFKLGEDAPEIHGLFGVAFRATSKTTTLRATGSLGLVVSVVQTFFKRGCKYSCGNSSPPDFNAQPGYVSPGLVADGGILLGGSPPSAKFFLGVRMFLDLAPTTAVGPDANAGYYAPYEDAPNGWLALRGPVFYVGPVLGVGFGH